PDPGGVLAADQGREGLFVAGEQIGDEPPVLARARLGLIRSNRRVHGSWLPRSSCSRKGEHPRSSARAPRSRKNRSPSLSAYAKEARSTTTPSVAMVSSAPTSSGIQGERSDPSRRRPIPPFPSASLWIRSMLADVAKAMPRRNRPDPRCSGTQPARGHGISWRPRSAVGGHEVDRGPLLAEPPYGGSWRARLIPSFPIRLRNVFGWSLRSFAAPSGPSITQP